MHPNTETWNDYQQKRIHSLEQTIAEKEAVIADIWRHVDDYADELAECKKRAYKTSIRRTSTVSRWNRIDNYLFIALCICIIYAVYVG